MPSHVVSSSIAVLLPASSMVMTTEEFFHPLLRIEMRRHQDSLCQRRRAGKQPCCHWPARVNGLRRRRNERERSHMAPQHVLDASPTPGRITFPTWRRLGMKSYSDKSGKKFAKRLRGAERRSSSGSRSMESRSTDMGAGPFGPWPSLRGCDECRAACRDRSQGAPRFLCLSRVRLNGPSWPSQVGDPAAESDVCLAAPPIIIRLPPTVLPLAIVLEAHWQTTFADVEASTRLTAQHRVTRRRLGVALPICQVASMALSALVATKWKFAIGTDCS